MNIKQLENVLNDIQESRMISYDVVMNAIQEGMIKAAAKHVDNIYPFKTTREYLERKENKIKREIQIRYDVDEKGNVRLYHQRLVTDEEIKDPAIAVDLEEGRMINPEAQIGDTVEEEVKIEDFGRNAVTQMKNIMLQQIKEANKQMVYNEFIDKIDDLVVGTVQTVEEKFVLIDLGKTIALMPKKEQIPGERYYDGQRLKVVIKSVSKDPKAAQVVVSRSNPNLVKRLFESSVTEIYDGTVEIKAIAREANERTKMAVFSNNPNVDPIGACIGPRGARVLAVIEEITQQGNPNSHENIDIFEWNPNFVEFVKNTMKPANVIGVFPHGDENGILVVVEDNQLSLAIGKKGINARLAVKLLGRKIDIKTQSDVEAEGIDWYNETLVFQAREESIRQQKAIDEARRIAEEEEAARKAELEVLAEQETIQEEVPAVEEVKDEEPVAEVQPVAEEEPVVVTEPVKEEQPVTVEEPVQEEAPVEEETAEEEPDQEKEVTKRRRPNLEKIKASEYVSKYEELADAKKASKQTSQTTKRKRNTKEDEEEAELRKKLEALKNREYEIKPEYSEEELEDFETYDDDHWYDDDVDYDDYDEFYDN